jgi:ATP-binding cassette subfamily B protein
MSEERIEQRPAERPAGGPRGGPMGAMGRPVEKAKNFKGTLKRLLGYLRPHRFHLAAVIIFASLSTIFSILSPKIMGEATTKLFEGLMMKMQQIPGAHIDFAYIKEIVLILIGLYLASALFSYIQQYIMAGVAQKTVYDMRKDIYSKLSRLPLKFFDSRTHGEILSRVTNDIDNIATTLQQSLTQLITSIVTLAGIVIMMLTISPILTLIILVTLPLYIVITSLVASRSQKFFAAQQKALGELNGHVEEMYT